MAYKYITILLVFISFGVAGAAEVPNIECKHPTLAKYDAPKLYKITSEKAAFPKSGFSCPPPGCPDKRYLVRGDVVIATGEAGSKVCASYQGAKGINIGILDKADIATATEAERVAALPKNRLDLFVNGHPLHPQCVFSFGERKEGQTLQQCQQEMLSQKGELDIELPNTIIANIPHKEGEYSYGEDSSTTYIGRVNGADIFHSYYSGGGTGRFTGLGAYKLKKGILQEVKTYAGGDRANGGIGKAKISRGKLLYSIAVTPYDIYLLAMGKKESKLKAYDQLDACAMCFAGSATFADDELLYVELDDGYQTANIAERGNHQQKFDSIMMQLIKTGKLKLNKTDLQIFRRVEKP